MVFLTVLTNLPEGCEEGVKEILAMYLEHFGPLSVTEIDRVPDGMKISLRIMSPEGSLSQIQRALAPYIKWFRDTKIVSITEEFPQQLNFNS